MVKKAAFSFLSSLSMRDIFSSSVLSTEFTFLNRSLALKSSAMEPLKPLRSSPGKIKPGRFYCFQYGNTNPDPFCKK